MIKLPKAIAVAAAGAALLIAAGGPALAQNAAEPEDATPNKPPAHMSQGHGAGQGHGGGAPASSDDAAPGHGSGMGHGTMGRGMKGHAMMSHGAMAHGMMSHGMMSHGAMGHAMMARAMMGHGLMGHGSMGYGSMGYGSMGHGKWLGGYGHGAAHGTSATESDKDLSVDDVRARIERSLKWHGNERLKVGEVKELDDGSIVAEIVTLDDSLVDRLKVDRRNGSMQRIE